MRFGLYLLRRGVITPAQLVAAFEAQQEDLAPLGQLAMEEGMLTVGEVFRVLRFQSDSAQDRFGDAAIALGLLTKGQLAELLMEQSNRQRPLDAVLLEQGAVDRGTLEAEREAFRRNRERSGATNARRLSVAASAPVSAVSAGAPQREPLGV